MFPAYSSTCGEAFSMRKSTNCYTGAVPYSNFGGVAGEPLDVSNFGALFSKHGAFENMGLMYT